MLHFIEVIRSFTFMFSVIFTKNTYVITLVIPGSIMRMFTAEEEVIRQGTGYLLISIPDFILHQWKKIFL